MGTAHTCSTRHRSALLLFSAASLAEAGRDACAARLSEADGAAAARRLACKCQAHLAAVPGGGVDRAHQAAAEDARRQRTTAPAVGATELVLEHGSGKRQVGGRVLVSHPAGCTRECVVLEADRSMTRMKVAQALEQAKEKRDSLPENITVDNGSEFCSRALETWTMTNEVQLCFIRPSRLVENGFIESFNGQLRDESLNVGWFSWLDDVPVKLTEFREHYNRERAGTVH
jgi:transposase InsO family protein